MPTEYKPADEDVLATMQEVIDRHTKFIDIRKYEVKIEVLLAWSDNNAPIKVHGAVAAASIKIVGGEERANGGPDVRIKIDAQRYASFRPRKREALFAHELYHLEVQYHDGGGIKRDVYGRPVLRCIPDDWTLTGFKQVADWYGPDSLEVVSHRTVGEILAQSSLRFCEPETIAQHLGSDVSLGELGKALFGSKGQTPSKVVFETFGALQSLGFTEERARQLILHALGDGRRFASVADLVEAVHVFDTKRNRDDGLAACAEANAAKGRVICGMCEGAGMRDESGADCPACEGSGWFDGAEIVEEAPAPKPTHAVYDRADGGAFPLGEVSAEHDGAALKLARAAWPKVPRDRLEVRRIPRSHKPAPAEAVAG